MSKITLNRVASLINAPTALNGIISQIESAFDRVLFRDGTSPNQMSAGIDMNSWRIFNLPAPASAHDAVRLSDLQDAVLGVPISDLVTADSVDYVQTGSGALTRTVTAKLNEVVSVKDFCVCDGVTDDSANILKAATALGTAGGSITFPNGVKVLVDSNLTLPSNVYLVGPYNFVGAPSISTSPAAYGSMSALIINSAATVKLGSNGGVCGLLVYRKGMTFPAANTASFAGTAFTANGDDVSIERTMILGFNRAYLSTNFNRFTSNHLCMDCVNGVKIENSLDFCRIYGAHYWPYSRMPAGTLTSAGTAFYFLNTIDGLELLNGFSFGAAIGAQVDNVNSWVIDNFWADNVPGSSTNGVVLNGDCYEGLLSNLRSSNNQNGLYMNVTPGVGVTLNGGAFWGSTQIGAYIIGGDLIVCGGTAFRACSTAGIYINDAVSNLLVDDARFSVTTPILPNVSTTKIQLGKIVSTGAAGTVIIGANKATATVSPTAGVIALPTYGSVFNVGAGDGSAITTLQGGWSDREVTLIFAATNTVNSASTPATNEIRLNGPTSAGANWKPNAVGATLTVKHNGAQWYETGRTSYAVGPRTVTATTDTISVADEDVIFNSSASCTVTLPNAASNTGRVLWFKNIAAFTVVSASSNVVPLAGGAAGTAILAATAGKWVRLRSDGSNWVMMAGN